MYIPQMSCGSSNAGQINLMNRNQCNEGIEHSQSSYVLALKLQSCNLSKLAQSSYNVIRTLSNRDWHSTCLCWWSSPDLNYFHCLISWLVCTTHACIQTHHMCMRWCMTAIVPHWCMQVHKSVSLSHPPTTSKPQISRNCIKQWHVCSTVMWLRCTWWGVWST